jgi:hypothetical protein
VVVIVPSLDSRFEPLIPLIFSLFYFPIFLYITNFLKKFLFFPYIILFPMFFLVIFLIYWSWWSLILFTRYMKVFFKNLLIMRKCSVWTSYRASYPTLLIHEEIRLLSWMKCDLWQNLWWNWHTVIVFGLHIGFQIQHCQSVTKSDYLSWIQCDLWRN